MEAQPYNFYNEDFSGDRECIRCHHWCNEEAADSLVVGKEFYCPMCVMDLRELVFAKICDGEEEDLTDAERAFAFEYVIQCL